MRFWRAAIVLGAVFVSAPSLVQAQTLYAKVVAACGTPPVTYVAGQQQPITMDVNGNFCGSNAGGGGGTVTLGAGSAIIGKVGIDQTTPGTTNGVTPVPSSASAAGVAHAQTAALASNLVAKGSAGNLYSFQVSADSTLSGAAWWLMIFDATALPADGAVAPAKCYAYPSGTTNVAYAFPTPIAFTTGVVLGVSTNGCFIKAASVHAFIGADVE